MGQVVAGLVIVNRGVVVEDVVVVGDVGDTVGLAGDPAQQAGGADAAVALRAADLPARHGLDHVGAVTERDRAPDDLGLGEVHEAVDDSQGAAQDGAGQGGHARDDRRRGGVRGQRPDARRRRTARGRP